MRPAISNETTHDKHESRHREPVRFLVRARIVMLDVDGERTIRVPLQIIAAAERVAIDGVVDGVARGRIVGRSYCSSSLILACRSSARCKRRPGAVAVIWGEATVEASGKVTVKAGKSDAPKRRSRSGGLPSQAHHHCRGAPADPARHRAR